MDYMEYERRYKSLNLAQKQAVDAVDGPVMVIAGPGTGKTELLTVRTAHILKQTDTLPENILCLTFTESGAHAMRERLAATIGKDAYKVSINTFHGFGTEIINQNAQFFYEGAHFRPADDLSRYEIIRSIFEKLGHNNILNKKMNGDYTYLSDTIKVISELKKSGLTSDELLEVLDANDSTIEKAELLLAPIFANKPTAKMANDLRTHIDALAASGVVSSLSTITPLSEILVSSLQTAIDSATATNKSTPITAWRNSWFKKNDRDEFFMKSRERQTKLRAISSIYEQYLARMQEAELFDFDDMILRVVHAMEIFDELRFNLQEKYQYIMVDEFQDTNMAQMRIIHNLTNNIAHGDSPNIMVVGDDDQAIYSFQGADSNNFSNFTTSYPTAKVVPLTDNYRSGKAILSDSRAVIIQGNDRLENRNPELDKSLSAKTKQGVGTIAVWEAESVSNERQFIVNKIKTSIENGKNPSDIALLTRKHREIEELLPYFVEAGINVSYERRDNVLDLPPIIFIEQLSRILIDIFIGQHKDVNALLPELLSHPAWGFAPASLWQLSLNAYNNRTGWLEEMPQMEVFEPLHDWLISIAFSIPHVPLESILDTIIGTKNNESSIDSPANDGYKSPFFSFFFSDETFKTNPDEYVRYLEALRTIRAKLRDYRPAETPTLPTFIEFIDLHRSIGSTITSVHSFEPKGNAIHVMTAHASKGLEFDTVYIIGAIDSVWGERARTHHSLIGYPENLPLAPAGDSSDERLRLFYVAMTRAMNELHISYSLHNDGAKPTDEVSFLLGTTSDSSKEIISSESTNDIVAEVQMRWYEPLIKQTSGDLKDILATQLTNYKLSVTHLTNFLDVTRGGPDMFLLQNLLRFPQAMNPAASYGSAIHQTLQRAHMYLATHNEHQPIEDILHNYEISLTNMHLSDEDFDTYLQKGSDHLQTFLQVRYDSFTSTQKVELDFSRQQVMIGDAHITGKLDLVDITMPKMMTVSDYKTGKPSRTWTGKTDYEKIKLHKYKMQLMFYKLLVENSRDWHGYTVEQGLLQYVEPTVTGDIVVLDTQFTAEEQDRLVLLVNAVWRRILDLDLPDITKYDQSLKGMLAFEQDLIDDTV